MPTVLKGHFPKRKDDDETFFSVILENMQKDEDRFTTRRFQNDIDDYLTCIHLKKLNIQYLFVFYGAYFLSLFYNAWSSNPDSFGLGEFIGVCTSVSLIWLAWKVTFPFLKYEDQIIDYLNYKSRGKKEERNEHKIAS